MELQAVRDVFVSIDALLIVQQKRLNALHAKVAVVYFLILQTVFYFGGKQTNGLVVVGSHEPYVALIALIEGLVNEAVADSDSLRPVFYFEALHTSLLLGSKAHCNVA